jgi:hypothetical protein
MQGLAPLSKYTMKAIPDTIVVRDGKGQVPGANERSWANITHDDFAERRVPMVSSMT